MSAHISFATLREAARSYATQIAAKCKAEKCEVGVLVVIIPREDPQPQWSTNLSMEGLRHLLDVLDQDATMRQLLIAPTPGGKS